MGHAYNFGSGVPRDHGKAREWYKKAAARGADDAQLSLENMAEIEEADQRLADAIQALIGTSASQQGARTDVPLSSLPRVTADTLERATVFVWASEGKKGSSGTGFFVAPGVIATNAHVVGSAKAKVHVINKALGSLCPAEIIAVSPVGNRDYALLRIPPNKAANAPVLRFAPKVRRADRVGTWGYPGAVSDRDPKYLALMRGDVKAVPEVVYSEGVVSTLLEQKPPRIVHTAIISHGNSGGPLVNERGEVVGINTWIDMDKQSYRQTNLSLPSSDLADFMRKNGVSPRMAPAAP
ncbi:conserved hypothetical protein [uncultured delta proteobacterium]|uniref:Serine protease n=1 Tax=uncultured delta proteobacterium TaxID=34034 RepID=A0A212KFP7_9DELT|nr:conserved hypothetical protein [uncultured delta proteobacterium]